MRPSRFTTTALTLGLLVAACGGSEVGGAVVEPGASAGGGIPRCEEIPTIAAPLESYGDTPVYVANEQPVEDLRAWAESKPGFEDLWLDRDHNGWVVLAFSVDAEARQQELATVFPGVGAVAVAVDWRKADLERLHAEVTRELMPDPVIVSGISITQGVVSVGVGLLTPERIAIVEARFGGERICLEGTDPADAPAPGPQQPTGDGWRLLADEPTGHAYRTGIAFDDASLRDLWATAGVTARVPDVDWGRDVVIWFGAVYGSSCPDLRLDDVVVTSGLVHADIVLLGAEGACTADANPRAYLVALDRSRLPAPPFAIQLSAEDPPAGAPEERTVVDADLRGPGSVAAPGQVHRDPNLPPPSWVEAGGNLEPGWPDTYRMSTHCGVEWLGPLNGITWRTTVPAGAIDFLPPAWSPVVAMDGSIFLELLMTEGPEPIVTATANGEGLVYRPSAVPAPGCD